VTATHLALVGPTASGKSQLALEVAQRLGDVEIVSVDSMQVYRGLDIGTAKPTPPERAAVPHHLVDIADPSEDWSVARFQAAARDAVTAIESRGRRALLVGGTGLYVQAVVDDLRFPGEDLALRAELEAWTSEPGGVAAAYAELSARDADAAARIDPHNARRIVRALEVIRLTGKLFSSFGPGVGSSGPTAFPVRMAGIWLPRATLADRIARRFAAMRAGGLLDEVRALAGSNGGLSRTARQAIGYKELLAHLEGQEPSLEVAFETAARRTRSFARRQRMWFRRDPRISWHGATENPASVLPALLASWSR
jgi:tRNA dimethylallyltransferase